MLSIITQIVYPTSRLDGVNALQPYLRRFLHMYWSPWVTLLQTRKWIMLSIASLHEFILDYPQCQSSNQSSRRNWTDWQLEQRHSAKEYQDPNWNNSRSCSWQRTSSRCTWGLAFSINLTRIPSRCLVHQWQLAMMAVKMIFRLRRVIIELLTVLTINLGSSNAIFWKYVGWWMPQAWMARQFGVPTTSVGPRDIPSFLTCSADVPPKVKHWNDEQSEFWQAGRWISLCPWFQAQGL